VQLNPVQSKIERVCLPELIGKEVSLFLKREDLLHPMISGNKYRKLYYNIKKAKALNATKLITFGGAYSNHILATASAGFEFGFKTLGIIRGEELAKDITKTLSINPTLNAAHKLGMDFHFISRKNYALKSTTTFLNDLLVRYPNAYIIPEGGTNALAVKGCEAILGEDTASFDIICCSIGTGGTISGIINSSLEHQRVIGFPALKGDFLKKEIANTCLNKGNWELVTDYHFGGYAKITKDLITFNNSFYQLTGILLDPIYTGKMVYGVVDLIQKNKIRAGSKILLIHTGGLQGINGMNTILAKKGLPLLINKIHE
jgi:1-aminocyclopropane-1-carboxylate deaminase